MAFSCFHQKKKVSDFQLSDSAHSDHHHAATSREREREKEREQHLFELIRQNVVRNALRRHIDLGEDGRNGRRRRIEVQCRSMVHQVDHRREEDVAAVLHQIAVQHQAFAQKLEQFAGCDLADFLSFAGGKAFGQFGEVEVVIAARSVQQQQDHRAVRQIGAKVAHRAGQRGVAELHRVLLVELEQLVIDPADHRLLLAQRRHIDPLLQLRRRQQHRAIHQLLIALQLHQFAPANRQLLAQHLSIQTIK